MEATKLVSIMTEDHRSEVNRTAEQNRSKLLAFIRKRVSSTEDAEDILQDVWFQLVSGYFLIDSFEKVTSWLYTVARNKITDWYRKKKPESFSQSQSWDDESGMNPLDEILVADIDDNPDTMMERSLITEQIDLALSELPEEQRDVFIMHELENKSFKEISEITGIGVNTLISRKRYAVVYMREQLVDLYEDLNS